MLRFLYLLSLKITTEMYMKLNVLEINYDLILFSDMTTLVIL